MKPGSLSLLVLLLWRGAGSLPAQSQPGHLQYKRSIQPAGPGQTCVVLDAPVFAHASPSLRDLRLFTSTGEVPYAVTMSETAEMTTDPVPAIDVHPEAAGVAFDLAMPARPYTDVILDLQQTDFLWTAAVSGANSLTAANRTPLGTFSLFDLTARHLSRSTVLHLQESAFRYLHVVLHGDRIAPRMVHGAQVPPSREAQTLYTSAGASSSVSQRGLETFASFQVPAHVPVERVSIELSPGSPGNFSRKVRVTGQAGSPGDPIETIEGAIARVHLGKVQTQQMAFPAEMGVNLQQNATIEVAIENGEEAPLPISSVRLEMRQRDICFDAPATPVNLFYGDRSLSAPASTSSAQVSSRPLPRLATLGPETRNPAFQESEDVRPLPDRRPDLLWFLLLAGLGMAGMLILRTLRRR